MTLAPLDFGPSLKALGTADWVAEVTGIVAKSGSVTRLGRKHWSIFMRASSTLLVTFETLQGIQSLSPEAHPLGWEFVRNQGWSHLAIVSDGDTWARDAAVYAHFDDLVDEAFFDGFDHVVFYGAGPCGYSAAAFSVVAPGARVLAIQPQATLDPRLASWDTRFTEQRRMNFTDRYGYAPDMLEAASRAYVLFDPHEALDAMHAALFHRPNVMALRLPNMGDTLQTDLWQMDILHDLIEAAGRGRLTPARFARLMRARRDHLPYLRHLLARLEREGREGLTEYLCKNVSTRMRAPRFKQRLKSMLDEAS